MTDQSPEVAREPVGADVPRHIKERGLAELKSIIDRMAEDPDWAPEPLDVIIAGIAPKPKAGQVFDEHGDQPYRG